MEYTLIIPEHINILRGSILNVLSVTFSITATKILQNIIIRNGSNPQNLLIAFFILHSPQMIFVIP